MRWASLAPEATLWIITAAGRQALVGRSHLCKEPLFVQKLPICTRPNAHREGWEVAMGPYAPDYGTISTLRPDGVAFLLEGNGLTMPEAELFSLFQKAVGYTVSLLPIKANDWTSYENLVQSIKETLGRGQRFERWFQAQLRRRDYLLAKVQSITHKPQVAWLQPTFPIASIGKWTTLLGEWSGADIAFSGERLLWERLLEVDPEVVIISLPGGTLKEAGEALSQWARLPQVQALRAFRAKRLYAFSGIAGIFYPSPLFVSAAEGLYELLHTPTYRFNQHIGHLWAPLL